MSDRTFSRTLRVRSIDDTTAVLLGVMRTLRSLGMELRAASMLMEDLADAELMARAAAGDFTAQAQLAFHALRVVTAGMGIFAGAQITAQRAALPVGQTTPGMFRGVQSTGAAIVHEGEVIGRPVLPSQPARITTPAGSSAGLPGAAGGGFSFNFYDSNLRYVDDAHELARVVFTDFYTDLTTFKSS